MERLINRRLVIAHNPHSSRAAAVEELVFDRLRTAGYAYEVIEVRQASLHDNVARLAPQIKADDIVLSAGGDGSAHAIFHTVLAAGQPGVKLGFLAFGNFNDIPNTFNTKLSLQDPVLFLEQAKTEEVWPISVFADDRPVRNALLYATIGWTAQAASQFDDPKVRQRITHGGAGVIKSLWRTSLYYMKSRRHSSLPAFQINGMHYKNMTDLLFANGLTVARLFHTGKRYYKKDVFLFRVLDVRGIIKNSPFLLSALAGRMRGSEINSVVVEFDTPSTMTLQCDGEVAQLKDVKRLEVKKLTTPLTILATK